MNEGNVQEVAADVLATAVQKAIELERERSDRELTVAVATTKREAKTEHRMDGLETRVGVLEGYIRKVGDSLESLKDHIIKRDEAQDRRNIEEDTKAREHWKNKGQALSRRQIYIGYASVFAVVAAPLVADAIKAFA
jgi:hypothetical protein